MSTTMIISIAIIAYFVIARISAHNVDKKIDTLKQQISQNKSKINSKSNTLPIEQTSPREVTRNDLVTQPDRKAGDRAADLFIQWDNTCIEYYTDDFGKASRIREKIIGNTPYPHPLYGLYAHYADDEYLNAVDFNYVSQEDHFDHIRKIVNLRREILQERDKYLASEHNELSEIDEESITDRIDSQYLELKRLHNRRKSMLAWPVILLTGWLSHPDYDADMIAIENVQAKRAKRMLEREERLLHKQYDETMKELDEQAEVQQQ